MPYIQIRSNKKIDEEAKTNIKNRLGQSISILGKSESWLMMEFVSNCDLYFKGQKDIDIAYVDVKLYGSSSPDSYSRMSGEISNLLNEYLNINPMNVYVSYAEYSNWGWNGNNF